MPWDVALGGMNAARVCPWLAAALGWVEVVGEQRTQRSTAQHSTAQQNPHYSRPLLRSGSSPCPCPCPSLACCWLSGTRTHPRPLPLLACTLPVQSKVKSMPQPVGLFSTSTDCVAGRGPGPRWSTRAERSWSGKLC